MTHMRLICLIASVCFAFYTMAEQNDDEVVLDNYDVDKNIPSGVHTHAKSMFRTKYVSANENEMFRRHWYPQVAQTWRICQV